MERKTAKPEHLAIEAAVQLRRAAAEAFASRGALHIAIPGGSVATLVFPAFAEAQLDWSRVHVWWADERAVKPGDPDSNYSIAHELWLSKVPANVHRMEAERPLQAAADAYAAALPHRSLDVVLLGAGPDGHVASLFPGHPALLARGKRVLVVENAPKPPPRRLTLSLPEILTAREVWVLATGAAKAQVVREATEDPTSMLPLALVLRGAHHARLWVDPAAEGD